MFLGINFSAYLILLFSDKRRLITPKVLRNSSTEIDFQNLYTYSFQKSITRKMIYFCKDHALFCLGSPDYYNEPSTGETEINLRIDAAENAFYSHGKNLMNQKIALKTRVQILDSLVRSRLTYSCPAWTLTTTQRDKIGSVYTSTLSKMVKNGYKRKEYQWSFVYTNEDIRRICHASDLSKFVMTQQLQQR